MYFIHDLLHYTTNRLNIHGNKHKVKNTYFGSVKGQNKVYKNPFWNYMIII